MTTKVEIGRAVYIDDAAIQFSNHEDWGWICQVNNGGELLSCVIQLTKIKKKLLVGFSNPFSKGEWKADILEDSLNDNKDNKIEVVALDFVQEVNGLPFKFTATIKINDKTFHTSSDQEKRISLAYYKNKHDMNRRLVPVSGYYPSYFFFMLGSTKSGKSCWLHALNTDKVRNRAIKQCKPWNITYSKSEAENTEPLKPTEVNDFKESAFNSFDLETTREQVHVFVVDVAGEINKREKRKTEPNIGNILGSILPYAAGIFVVYNKEWFFKEPQEKDEIDPFDTIIDLKRGGLTEDKFCYILTGGDRIKKDVEKDSTKGEEYSLTSQSPILRPTDGSEEQMLENMAIASNFMKERDERVGNSPCFVVSCCSDTEDGRLEFKDAYNAELPIVYMLRSLI